MQLLQAASKLFYRQHRVTLSKYPSARTPELREAWSHPQVRFTATPQPYTSPLTMYGGNTVMNGETVEMRREYREWSMREPPVKAALLTKCFAVASLDPQWIPDNPKDQRDKEAAQWCDWATSRVAGGLPGLIQNMILPALIDGFSVLEKVYGEVDSLGRKYSKWWTLRRTAMMDTEHIRFKMDEYRQVIGVRPMTGLMGWQELPPESFLIFTHLKLYENPFGISDLRAVVRDVRFLEAAVKLRHTLLTNFSGPFLKAVHGDIGVRDQLAAILAEARGNGFIVCPEGTELDVINLATSNPAVFDAVIQSHRENIVSGIQGGYLQLLEGGISDGRGNTQVHKGIAELFQWWLACWVCEVINLQLVPDLVRPNVGNSVGLPRLQLGGIDEATVSAALDRFKRGQELGLKLSVEQVMSTGGFESPRDANDILVPPQPSAAGGQGGGLFDMSAAGGQFTDRFPYSERTGGTPALAGTFRE